MLFHYTTKPLDRQIELYESVSIYRSLVHLALLAYLAYLALLAFRAYFALAQAPGLLHSKDRMPNAVPGAVRTWGRAA